MFQEQKHTYQSGQRKGRQRVKLSEAEIEIAKWEKPAAYTFIMLLTTIMSLLWTRNNWAFLMACHNPQLSLCALLLLHTLYFSRSQLWTFSNRGIIPANEWSTLLAMKWGVCLLWCCHECTFHGSWMFLYPKQDDSLCLAQMPGVKQPSILSSAKAWTKLMCFTTADLRHHKTDLITMALFYESALTLQASLPRQGASCSENSVTQSQQHTFMPGVIRTTATPSTKSQAKAQKWQEEVANYLQ